MIGRRRVLPFAAAVTGLLLVAPAARADVDECWIRRPPCATGAIIGHHIEPSHNGGDVSIRLGGWSALCPPDGPSAPPSPTAGEESNPAVIAWIRKVAARG